MNNFFFDESDYSLFRKALKTTDNEPIVINILSTDSSLQSREDKTAEVASARKNMSKKYEPSPFGKFFGPRKQQSVSVDMKDFSSWKNKNYRKTEKSLDDRTNSEVKFSVADFMNDKSSGTFNELDQAKSDLQKPINQLSTSDPLYKRFSLDSYMHKLEEQTLTKDSFEENDDILEPLGTDTQSVVPDSSQDENFGFGSNINIEKFAFDDNTSGDEFKFEQEELDKFRARLDKIEREAANIKEKSTQKLIDSNELSEISGGFNIDKLTDESDESSTSSINSTETSVETDSNNDTPKVKHKTFFEVNKNDGAVKKRTGSGLLAAFEDAEQESSAVATAGVDDELTFGVVSDSDGVEPEETLQTGETEEVGGLDELLTEEDSAAQEDSAIQEDEESQDVAVDENDSIDDFDLTEEDGEDELLTEAETTKSQSEDLDAVGETETIPAAGEQIVAPYGQDIVTPVADPGAMYGYPETGHRTQIVAPSYVDESAELKAQLQELIDSNKKLDYEHGQKLREAELEKERVAAEYESRIREMEKSFKESYEDFKKQAYLDKLDRDIKLKEAETKFKKKTEKIKEEEKESYSKEKLGVMLRKELKSNLNISNLEMDKKLLEVASKLNKDNYDKLFAENTEMVRKMEEEAARAAAEEEARRAAELAEAEAEDEEVEEVEEVEEIDEETSAKTTKSKSSTRKSTTRKRKPTTRKTTTARRSPRRKIDSDIIGGIDFD